jgi:hypothetical protein
VKAGGFAYAKVMELTPTQQIAEIKAEFYDEAEAFKRNRSPIERQQALNHINGLLDAYHIISVELCYADGLGSE